jgi:hypothetical protein
VKTIAYTQYAIERLNLKQEDISEYKFQEEPKWQLWAEMFTFQFNSRLFSSTVDFSAEKSAFQILGPKVWLLS